MRLPNILLSVSLIIAESLANAQQFKVLKDTVDYKLMEVDSGYYYSHGIEMKNDLFLDTNIYKKKNGILRLPLLNGKFKELRDTSSNTNDKVYRTYVLIGEFGQIGYYFVLLAEYEGERSFVIDKRNGEVYLLNNHPKYSPSELFYAYDLVRYIKSESDFVIKSLKSNRTFNVDFVNPFPFGDVVIKWINDYSFMCLVDVNDPTSYKVLGNKYFLVEIKK